MEAHGYVERVRERVDAGRVVTRTYAYNAPALTRARGVAGEEPVAAAASVAAPVAAPAGPVPVRPVAEAEFAEDVTVVEEEPVEGDPGAEHPLVPPAAEAADNPDASERGEHHDKAVALLVGLRRTDDRFTLSKKDVRRLTPAVIAWFDNGASKAAVHHAMTADVPVPLKNPARFLAYRLSELLPPPLPVLPVLPEAAEGWVAERVPTQWYEMVDCAGGCGRPFRRPPGTWCRDCRAERDRRTAGAEGAMGAAGAVGWQDPNPSVPPSSSVPPESSESSEPDSGRTDPPGFPRSAA